MPNDFHRTFVDDDSFIRGAARIMWANMTMARPTRINNVINVTSGTATTYNAQSGWNDLGATKTGIQITVNNAEETFDVDQVIGDIKAEPTNWEVSVATQLAEMTLERLQVAWEGDTVQAGADSNETQTGIGQPTAYTLRRLAVLFQKSNGKIRAYLFHKVQRTPQESTVTHAKTGEQISIPVRFKVLADTSVATVRQRFFLILDQNAPT